MLANEKYEIPPYNTNPTVKNEQYTLDENVMNKNDIHEGDYRTQYE